MKQLIIFLLTLLPIIAVAQIPTKSTQGPVGTTAQRPVAPNIGEYRFNSDSLYNFEWWDGSAWVSLSGFVQGTGTTNTVPLWTGTNTLGNSALTQPSATEMSMGTLTGALEMPTGTAAQAPVWANGKLRYNTTSSGFQGGPSGLFLPWADAASFTNQYIPYSNGTRLTSSNKLSFNDGGLAVGNISAATNISLKLRTQSAGALIYGYNDSGTERFRVTGTGQIEWNNQNDGEVLALGSGSILKSTATYQQGVVMRTNSSGGNKAWSFRIDAGTPYACLGGNQLGNNTQEVGIFALNTIAGARNSSTLTVRGASGGWSGGNGGNIVLSGGNSTAQSESGGNVFIRGGAVNEPAGALNFNGVPGYIAIQTYADTNTVNAGLGELVTVIRVNGGDKQFTTQLHRLQQTTSGTRILTMESDTVKYRIENLGTISTSTDGSGDIVVAHGMGTTPTSVQVTVTGTTPYVVTVHTIDATNFTVRFYDMTGAEVASTAVTATWHAKT